MALMAQQVDGNNQLLSSGDLYQGMSRSIPNGRVVLPYGLEVTFEKTVHLIFPAAIRYVDLGSQNIIAGKADDAENVLRVKAAVREFETETNMSVTSSCLSSDSVNCSKAKTILSERPAPIHKQKDK